MTTDNSPFHQHGCNQRLQLRGESVFPDVNQNLIICIVDRSFESLVGRIWILLHIFILLIWLGLSSSYE